MTSWRPPLDVLFAATAVSLAVLSLRSAPLGWAGVLLAVLYGLAAAGFLRRGPAAGHPTLTQQVAALPGVAVGGVALLAAGPVSTWPYGSWAMFAVGGLLAAWCVRSLRGSFAVLPARRALVTTGPYAWVRHPMYAGELLMVGACALAAGGLVGIGLACLALATITARVLVEEQVLADDPDWAAYVARVRWWWVPGWL